MPWLLESKSCSFKTQLNSAVLLFPRLQIDSRWAATAEAGNKCENRPNGPGEHDSFNRKRIKGLVKIKRAEIMKRVMICISTLNAFQTKSE